MIKVGQIYQYKNHRVLITKVEWETDEFIIEKYITSSISAIECNGTCYDDLINSCVINFNEMTLIAEYPTWQEAVNSKEFKE